MNKTCEDCQHYLKDEIGAYSLGDCAENVVRDSIAFVKHKGETELHHQELPLYPGQKACNKWKEK